MANSYATNTHIVKMETGFKNWGSIINANYELLDKLTPIAGCNVVPFDAPTSISRKVEVRPGSIVRTSDGAVVTYPGITLTLAASSVLSIYIRPSDGFTGVGTGGWPTFEHVPLAVVTTGPDTILSIVDARIPLRSVGSPTASVMGPSGPSHKGGLVPDTPALAGTTRYLNEDATWKEPPVFLGSGTNAAVGQVPKPSLTSGNRMFLCENATWVVPPTFSASGPGAAQGAVPSPGTTAGTRRVLLENVSWGTPPVFIGSGASAATGGVPSPGTTAGNTRFLCENATWSTIPVFVASGVLHAPGLVPDPPVTPGTSKFLREDATWTTITTMVASGAGGAGGLVPTPGTTAGTLRYLREDATWTMPGGLTVASAFHQFINTAVSTTLLWAPTDNNALYELHAYLTVTTVGTSGNLQVVVEWSQSGFTRTETVLTLPVNALGYAKASFPIYLTNTGDGIKYSTSFTGTAGSVSYSLLIGVSKIFKAGI